MLLVHMSETLVPTIILLHTSFYVFICHPFELQNTFLKTHTLSIIRYDQPISHIRISFLFLMVLTAYMLYTASTWPSIFDMIVMQNHFIYSNNNYKILNSEISFIKNLTLFKTAPCFMCQRRNLLNCYVIFL